MTPRAVLLIGPTASGKTPLGDALERNGLWGRRCVHFDFGAQLRAAAENRDPAASLSDEEMGIVRTVLQTGALLEDGQFHVARRILRAFLAARRLDNETIVVLNGLPRHVGQARDIADDVRVETVVLLECSHEVILARIRADSGGDRAERIDDDSASVAQRIEMFRERTAPLVEHYRSRGARIIALSVRPATSAAELREALEQTAKKKPR